MSKRGSLAPLLVNVCLADKAAFSAKKYGIANEPLAILQNVFNIKYRDLRARWLDFLDQGARVRMFLILSSIITCLLQFMSRQHYVCLHRRRMPRAISITV